MELKLTREEMVRIHVTKETTEQLSIEFGMTRNGLAVALTTEEVTELNIEIEREVVTTLELIEKPRPKLVAIAFTI